MWATGVIQILRSLWFALNNYALWIMSLFHIWIHNAHVEKDFCDYKFTQLIFSWLGNHLSKGVWREAMVLMIEMFVLWCWNQTQGLKQASQMFCHWVISLILVRFVSCFFNFLARLTDAVWRVGCMYVYVKVIPASFFSCCCLFWGHTW